MTVKAPYIVERRSNRAFVLRKDQYGGTDIYEQLAEGFDTGTLDELVKHANLGFELESNSTDSEGAAQSDADGEERIDWEGYVTDVLRSRGSVEIAGVRISPVNEPMNTGQENAFVELANHPFFEKARRSQDGPLLGQMLEALNAHMYSAGEKSEPEPEPESEFAVGSPEWMGARAAKEIRQGLDFFTRFSAGAEGILKTFGEDAEAKGSPEREDEEPEPGDVWYVEWLKAPGLLKREAGVVYREADGLALVLNDADGTTKRIRFDDSRIIKRYLNWRG